MSLLGHQISCLHQTPPVITKGRTVGASTTTSFNIDGSIQEVSSAELSSLPEHRRLKAGTYVVITFDVLITTDDDQYPDLVVYNGKNYEVVSKANWNNSLIDHNVYVIQEVRSR